MRFSSRPCTATEECQIFTPERDRRKIRNKDKNKTISILKTKTIIITLARKTTTQILDTFPGTPPRKTKPLMASSRTIKKCWRKWKRRRLKSRHRESLTLVWLGKVNAPNEGVRGDAFGERKFYPLWMNSNQT